MFYVTPKKSLLHKTQHCELILQIWFFQYSLQVVCLMGMEGGAEEKNGEFNMNVENVQTYPHQRPVETEIDVEIFSRISKHVTDCCAIDKKVSLTDFAISFVGWKAN